MRSDASRATPTPSVPTRNDATGLTYDALRVIAMGLPDVVESTSYGTPAFKVRGKLMVRLKEDNDTVVVRTTWEERERLMVLHPDIFHLTDHYRAYPWVLMRLSKASVEIAALVLADARHCSTPARTKKAKLP